MVFFQTSGLRVRMSSTSATYQAPYQETKASRPVTIDDVVTKTGFTLAVLTATAVVSYFLVASNLALAMPLTLIVLELAWISYGTVSFWSGHLADLFGNIGRLGVSLNENVGQRLQGDAWRLKELWLFLKAEEQ